MGLWSRKWDKDAFAEKLLAKLGLEPSAGIPTTGAEELDQWLGKEKRRWGKAFDVNEALNRKDVVGTYLDILIARAAGEEDFKRLKILVKHGANIYNRRHNATGDNMLDQFLGTRFLWANQAHWALSLGVEPGQKKEIAAGQIRNWTHGIDAAEIPKIHETILGLKKLGLQPGKYFLHECLHQLNPPRSDEELFWQSVALFGADFFPGVTQPPQNEEQRQQLLNTICTGDGSHEMNLRDFGPQHFDHYWNVLQKLGDTSLSTCLKTQSTKWFEQGQPGLALSGVLSTARWPQLSTAMSRAGRSDELAEAWQKLEPNWQKKYAPHPVPP